MQSCLVKRSITELIAGKHQGNVLSALLNNFETAREATETAYNSDGSAMKELEKLPEDKVGFVLQIMQGVDGLYYDNQSERKEAFARLEQLRKKGTVDDFDAELASYREEKYGK